MKKYIHNKSGVTKLYLGTEILDTEYFLIPPLEEVKYMENSVLIDDLTTDNASMSIDGLVDLSVADSLIFLAYRDESFEQRFRSNPERINNFISKNAQEAIEEAALNTENNGASIRIQTNHMNFSSDFTVINEGPLIDGRVKVSVTPASIEGGTFLPSYVISSKCCPSTVFTRKGSFVLNRRCA